MARIGKVRRTPPTVTPDAVGGATLTPTAGLEDSGLPSSAATPGLDVDPESPVEVRGVPLLLPLVSELKIITKDGRFVRLGDVLKPAQVDFIARCQHQLDTRGQIRIVTLKARQIGISTVIEAIIFVLSMLVPHLKSMIISHEDKSSTHILNMTRNYWKTYIFARYYNTVYNGKNHLSWDNDSDIHIATAKNVDAGRSTTIRALHGSEVAFWPDADTLMTGLSNAIPSFGLNVVFLESTANGVGNYFHKICNAARRGDSEYEFVFYPWYTDPEYTAQSIPPEVRAKYASVQLKPEEMEEERTLRERYGVTDSQLIWRRWHIANKCNGDVERFHQEMPTTPDEAFISTGRNVFHLPNLIKHYEPRKGKRGNLISVGRRIEFREDPMGYLTLYSLPSNDMDWGVYLCGGDPTHTMQGDYACIQVINRRTLEQVAVYRRKIDPITFGKDMQRVGRFFNDALLAPEKEGPGYATVGCLVADDYPYVYQSTRVDKMQGKPTTDLYGWSTNVNTKELAIAQLVKLFSDPVVDVGGSRYGLILHDEITLMELRDFVTTEKGLGYENSDGSEYDDGVMALAIACTVHSIEPKPPAYSNDALTRPQFVIDPSVTNKQGEVVIDRRPRDTPLLADDPSNELPLTPIWETWDTPRDYLS